MQDVNFLNTNLQYGQNLILKPKWIFVDGRYISSNVLCIGRVRVVSYHYNGVRTSESDLEYAVSSDMVGIKKSLGAYRTEAEAQEKCLKVLEVYLKMLKDE